MSDLVKLNPHMKKLNDEQLQQIGKDFFEKLTSTDIHLISELLANAQATSEADYEETRDNFCQACAFLVTVRARVNAFNSRLTPPDESPVAIAPGQQPVKSSQRVNPQ